MNPPTLSYVEACSSFFRIACFAVLVSAITACGGGEKEIVAVVPAKQVQAIVMPSPGEERDLIVVFDDSVIEAEATNVIRRRALHAGHADILELKASRLKAMKIQVLETADKSDFVERQTYSQLPISRFAVRDDAAAERLRKLPGVVGVYKNEIHQKLFLAQSLPMVRQPQALAAGADGRGTSVVVLDTLVDFSNSAFGTCTSPGQPAACKVIIARDVDGKQNDGLGFQEHHGTNVAATVVAVAPATKIIGLNVFNGAGASTNDVLSGINWAISNKSQYNIVALNMSLGGGKYTSPIVSGPYNLAISRLRSSGIVPVAAAGNDGYRDSLGSPAAVQGVVSVGAVYDQDYGRKGWLGKANCTDFNTYDDLVTCFSDSSSFLTLLAPGAMSDAAGFIKGGTSQASPFVAGAVAVLKSVYPQDIVDQTIFRLTQGPRITDPKSGIATPRLQLDKSLSLSPCLYTVSKTSISVSASGGTYSDVQVTTPNGCTWKPESSVNWISFDSDAINNGNGVIQYNIAPNNSTASRTGNISIFGLNVVITQAGGAKSLSSSSNIWINDTYGYSAPGDGTITLRADEIYNSSLFRTSGSLRLELWLSTTPFREISTFSGWQIATARIINSSNGTLPAGFVYTNLNLTTTLKSLPKPNRYYATFVVSEFSSTCSGDGYCFVAAAGFRNFYTVFDETPPTQPTGLFASPIDGTAVGLRWSPSFDNVKVAKYDIYNNGSLIGSLDGSKVTATVINLAPQSAYIFTVRACDEAENCSAVSSSASVTTPLLQLNQVHRFANPITGGHFFTSNTSEKDYVLANLPSFKYEGIGYKVSPTQITGTLPVVRYSNRTSGFHLFSIDAQQQATLNADPLYRLDGVAFYAYPTASSGSSPVYRFRNTVSGASFWTTNESEREYVVKNLPAYVYEGISFYAM